jgi:hypothetical protein
MTRLTIIAALFLSACGPHVSTGPSAILSERDSPRSDDPPKRDGICTEARSGCIGGEFPKPWQELTPEEREALE